MRIPDWLKITPKWTIETVDINGMSFPARVCLWMGVGLLSYGFLIDAYALMVLGLVLILAGSGLWWIYHPNKWGWLRKTKMGQKILRHNKAASLNSGRPGKPQNQRKPSAQERVNMVSKRKLKETIDSGKKTLDELRDAKKNLDK